MDLAEPWAVLGIAPGSPVSEARAARRRLARQLHPDLHPGASPADRAEWAARMALVNWALAQIEQSWGKRERAGEASVGPDDPAVVRARPRTGGSRQQVDAAPSHASGDRPDSFSMGCLPVEAFEALFVAAYGLGDILVTEEPYLLELYLTEPAPCFCLVTIFPEAGGSMVTLDISPALDSVAPPKAAAVRAVLVAELNGLAPPS